VHVLGRAEQEGKVGYDRLGRDRVQRREVDPVDVEPTEDRDLQCVLLFTELAAGVAPYAQAAAGAIFEQLTHVRDGGNGRVVERVGVGGAQRAFADTSRAATEGKRGTPE
jgi:hypothetical protein